MSSRTVRRLRPLAVLLAAGSGIAIVAVPAEAAVERFHRFEVDATANFTVLTDCPDGSTAQTRVTVVGGREKESVNREPTLDNEFVTVFVQSLDCDGTFGSRTETGNGDFAASRSLNRASVTGTIVTATGSIAVDLQWTGAGDLERTRNVTQFPGFRGVFVGREREATASGSVVIDGAAIVDGTADDALVETLEDRNVTRTNP